MYVDNNKYKVNSIIPKWSNWKFHSLDIAVTSRGDYIVSHMQLTITGASRIRYNDNFLHGGSFVIEIDEQGRVLAGGSSPCAVQSYVTNICMFN